MAVDESRDQTGVYKSDLSSKLVQGIKCSKRSNFCRPGKKHVKSSNFFMVLTFIIFSVFLNMLVKVKKEHIYRKIWQVWTLKLEFLKSENY